MALKGQRAKGQNNGQEISPITFGDYHGVIPGKRRFPASLSFCITATAIRFRSINRYRYAPLEMSPDEFRTVGHQLIDRIADFLASLPERPVSRGKIAGEIRHVLGDSPLSEQGTPPGDLLDEAADLLYEPVYCWREADRHMPTVRYVCHPQRNVATRPRGVVRINSLGYR
jgi:hypothetical protein